MLNEYGLLQLMKLSVLQPRAGASRVCAYNPSVPTLIRMAILVSILAALLSHTGVSLIGSDLLLSGAPASPVFIAIVDGSVLCGLAGATYKIGALFGGTGTFRQTLLLMVWFESIMLVFYCAQILLILVLPILGIVLPFLTILLFFWLFVNFVVTLHEFRSGAKVLAATVGSFIAVTYLLASLVAFVAGLLS